MKKQRLADISVTIFILSYILYFSLLSLLKYRSFAYQDYDLSTNAYSIWGILQGILYNPIYAGNFLGNHANFIFFPLSLIHWLLTHPLTLLFLQSLFLGLAALPLYLIAKEEIGKGFACLVIFMYIFYPALGYTNLFEFHPTVFATAFLMFMFYYFKKGRFSYSSIFMILAMLCQENIALVIAMFGLYCLLVRRGLKWGVSFLLAGLVWFYICVFVIIPYFNKDTFQLFNFYSHFGSNIPEAARNILLHPLDTFKFILKNPLNATYLVSLFSPLAFIPLLGWKELLIILPLFAQHLLSIRQTEHTIYYHYTAEMIPFIFIACVYGIKKMQSAKSFKILKNIFLFTIILLTIIANIALGPHLKLLVNFKSLYRDERDSIKERLVKMVPQEAGVIATFEFLPHLLYRKHIYSFHNIVTGVIPYSNKKFKLPKEAEYALIDFIDPLTFSCFYREGVGNINIRNFFAENQWRVIEEKDSIALFKRN